MHGDDFTVCLQACRQEVQNGSRITVRPVSEHHVEFADILSTCTTSTCLCDIANVFLMNLQEFIKNKVIRDR